VVRVVLRFSDGKNTLTLTFGLWMSWLKAFGGGGGFKGVWWIQTDLVFWMDEFFFFFSGDH